MVRIPFTRSLVWILIVGVALKAHGATASDGYTPDCKGNPFYDVTFVLDRSESMRFSVDASVDDQNNDLYGKECPTSIDNPDCAKQDIMRSVLRKVLYETFVIFQQPCLEYMEQTYYGIGYDSDDTEMLKPCETRFTQPIFNIAFWSGPEESKTEVVIAKRFIGPWGPQKDWNKMFTDRFYALDTTSKTYKLKAGMWRNSVNGIVMNTDEVRRFFEQDLFGKDSDGEMFKGSTEVPGARTYPISLGKTYLKLGLEAAKNLLSERYSANYGSEEGKGAVFPVYVMTDGELTNTTQQNLNVLKALVNDIQIAVNGQAKFYGLGLTAKDDDDLLNAQTELYSELGLKFGDENGDLYVFNDQQTASALVTSITGNLMEGCEECADADAEYDRENQVCVCKKGYYGDGRVCEVCPSGWLAKNNINSGTGTITERCECNATSCSDPEALEEEADNTPLILAGVLGILALALLLALLLFLCLRKKKESGSAEEKNEMMGTTPNRNPLFEYATMEQMNPVFDG